MPNLLEALHEHTGRGRDAGVNVTTQIKDIRQIGAIPVLTVAPDRVEVVLVTTRGSGRWTIPKGNRMAGLPDYRAAETEALQRERLLQEVALPVFADLMPGAVVPGRAWVASRLTVFVVGLPWGTVLRDAFMPALSLDPDYVVAVVAVFGTMIADGPHVALGSPYWVDSIIYFVLLCGLLTWWYRTEGTLSVHSITTSRRERFYWGTVLLTFGLGTALGDAAAWPIQGLIAHFRHEIEARIDEFSRNADPHRAALVAAE